MRKRMIGNTHLLGHRHTETTKRKISKANKGRSPSILTRQKARERMIERNRNNPPRLGKKCSPEHRRKLSEARKHYVCNESKKRAQSSLSRDSSIRNKRNSKR